MLYLRMSLEQEAQRIRSVGGLDGVPSATVLLAFLRKLQAEGWAVEESISRSGKEASDGMLRVLREHIEASRPPFERGLDGQQAGEPANALRVLSSILARHAQAAWTQAIAADAEVGFPIGSGAIGRVGRLRAYGNAIVPQQAAAFVASYLEVEGFTAIEAAA